MTSSKGVANRRKSIAVTSNQNKPVNTTKKRRAHSIAPGERISPVSKARRSLAPRKSILKASLNFNFGGDEVQPEDETELGSGGDSVTHDFRAEIRDNTTQRASFARRVSFAEHAYVRLFNKDNNKANTPPSSSASTRGARVTDENAYPGSSVLARRRSSLRRSVGFSEQGEESMDMDMDETAPGPSAFMFAQGDRAMIDDVDEDYEGEEDDMEMTEAISQNIIRKRSLSLGLQGRRPLSNLPPRPRDSINPQHDYEHGYPSSEQDHDQSQDQSYSEDNTTSTSTSTSTDLDQSQPIEYTVPLMKPPAPPSDAWLALRSVTHSGDTPYEAPPSDDDDDDDGLGEQGMELTDAVQRLMAVRQSLGFGTETGRGDQAAGEAQADDSFASTNTNDSFKDENKGDQTINVTGLIRRASMAATTDADSTMEVTGDYGAGIVDQVGRLSVGPVHFQEQSGSAQELRPAAKPSIFSAPTSLSPSKQTKSAVASQPHATVLKPFNFTFTPKPQAPASPSKVQPTKIPTPVFSVAVDARSSPKKRPVPVVDRNHGANGELEPEDRPSPAKKIAVAGRWPDPSSGPAAGTKLTSASKSISADTPKAPSRLSPSKKAPFLAPKAPSEAKKSTGPMRRPSGYFAQRKSLGVPGATAAPLRPNNSSAGAKTSPKKGAGRMSVGHGNPSATVRFDVAAEKEKVQQEREIRELQVPSSPTRISPARELPRPDYPVINHDRDEDMDVGPVNPAAQWREDVVQEQSFVEDDDRPPISIEQFFNMTGIRFMDEIMAPRRSTIHPSALRPRRHSSPSSSTESSISLAEYVTAMAVDVPQLELYTYVSKDLEAWIERSKGIFMEAEAEAEKITPELFREFVGAGEEGQAELLHQLKLIKANTHGNAKGEWYDWKLQWIEQLYGKAEKGFAALEEDAKALEVIISQAQALVPSLQDEYEQVTQELEHEKVLVAEIENSDQEYLNELKTTISEQNAELEAFRADLAEGNAKLERLEEKLQELNLQKEEATSAIEKAERLIHIQKNSTRSEVFRLKDELESLEDLHLWRATKIQPDLLEFIYAAAYRVSIPCIKFKPVVDKLDIKQLDNLKIELKDAFPQLTDLMFRMAKQKIVLERGNITIRTIVQRLSDYWSSCAQVRSQLKLVAIKYPVSIETTRDTTPAFKATATMVFPNIKAKAYISFILDLETFSSWPMSIASTKCEAKVAYGPVECNTILTAVLDRLSQATPAQNHACLLDACIEAMDQYAK